MDLQSFLHQYNIPGSVIQLEVKRGNKDEDKQLIINLREELAESSKYNKKE